MEEKFNRNALSFHVLGAPDACLSTLFFKLPKFASIGNVWLMANVLSKLQNNILPLTLIEHLFKVIWPLIMFSKYNPNSRNLGTF